MNNPLSFGRMALTGPCAQTNKVTVANAATQFNIISFNNSLVREPYLPGLYEIFLFTQGAGILKCGHTKTKIERGTVLCTHPGSSIGIASHNLQGYHISFSSSFLIATDVAPIPMLFKWLCLSNKEPLVAILAGDVLETLIAIAVSLQRECVTHREESKEILQGLFFVFMTYLPYASKTVRQFAFSDRLFEYTNRFIALVKAHYHTHKQVTDYARMMCMTPGFLNKVIKEKTGRTASSHICAIIVLEAKRRATFTTASMKEIAYELGFVDIYHFSKFFKRNSGTSFSLFRKARAALALHNVE